MLAFYMNFMKVNPYRSDVSSREGRAFLGTKHPAEQKPEGS